MRSVESEYIHKVVFFNKLISIQGKNQTVTQNPFQSLLPKVSLEKYYKIKIYWKPKLEQEFHIETLYYKEKTLILNHKLELNLK